MAEQTNIYWCDSTFNPWEGCTKISPGCERCYAEARNRRFAGGKNWGPGAPRRRTVSGNWAKPIAWNAKAEASGRPWRVFCASLADVFDNEVPDQWRADLFALIAATPALTWMLLTKRIGNVPGMVSPPWQEHGWPAGIWLGATVVNQEEADRDIPKLLRIPARLSFLSMEPLLEPVSLAEFQPFRRGRGPLYGARGILNNAIDWVIVGGESGPQARPFNMDWPLDIIRQCHAAGVPVFVKQMGANAICEVTPGVFQAWGFNSRAGTDMAEWPSQLRVQEFPA